ncbi:flagellar biosynthetic protein FliQ [Undibacterium sp. FT147W]|uniref:Flagellar biosynthetic protein FliQ n=1 Tax=Undibacterium rivi TaxID=2828729 RepID=A0ABS5H0U9_9BURK|nr:flagellar biosynthetic protein FliQ [Undibacterium rivi]MBR7792335.1 flagellar biosynthetic protein FliQ [Undibacterium rivi]
MPNHPTRRHYRDSLFGQQLADEQEVSHKRANQLAYVVQIVAVLIVILITLGWMGEEQLSDQLKSEAVISNTKHVAALDAAERRREAIAVAALGDAEASEQP